MRHQVIVPTALLLCLTGCYGSDSLAEPAAEPASDTASGTVEDSATDPGTTLDFGEPATLVWQPTSDLTGVLDLTVEAVAEQPRSVLDGWARDEAMAAARPYFVTVSLANVGESDLAGQVVPLYLRDDNGALGAPWTMGGDFTACQSGPLPSPFEPGAEAEMCLVYLVPDRARIQDIVFEPTEGYDPITWTGEVERPDRRTDEDGRTGEDGRKKSR